MGNNGGSLKLRDLSTLRGQSRSHSSAVLPPSMSSASLLLSKSPSNVENDDVDGKEIWRGHLGKAHTHCERCGQAFTFLNRRHHCRSCSLPVCSDCSPNSIPIPQYRYYSAVRVCRICYPSIVRLQAAEMQARSSVEAENAAHNKHSPLPPLCVEAFPVYPTVVEHSNDLPNNSLSFSSLLPQPPPSMVGFRRLPLDMILQAAQRERLYWSSIDDLTQYLKEKFLALEAEHSNETSKIVKGIDMSSIVKDWQDLLFIQNKIKTVALACDRVKTEEGKAARDSIVSTQLEKVKRTAHDLELLEEKQKNRLCRNIQYLTDMERFLANQPTELPHYRRPEGANGSGRPENEGIRDCATVVAGGSEDIALQWLEDSLEAYLQWRIDLLECAGEAMDRTDRAIENLRECLTVEKTIFTKSETSKEEFFKGFAHAARVMACSLALQQRLINEKTEAVAETTRALHHEADKILREYSAIVTDGSKLDNLLEKKDKLTQDAFKAEETLIDMSAEWQRLALKLRGDLSPEGAARVSRAHGRVIDQQKLLRSVSSELSVINEQLKDISKTHPEIFCDERRLIPHSMQHLPIVVSNRKLQDYSDQSLVGGSRHLVFRAMYKGDIFALKQIPLEDQNRFEKEVMLLCRLRHPSVVAVSACFLDSMFGYIQMPFFPKGTIYDWVVARDGTSTSRSNTVNAGQASWTVIRSRSQIRTMFRMLLNGIAYLHDKGVIHRDLKPENIMIGPAEGDADSSMESPIIIDFGISKDNSLIATRTGDGYGVGTDGYIAPEIFLGASAGPASDMWSFGVILFRSVFDGNTPCVLESKVVVIPADDDADLRNLLSSLLSLNASRRLTAIDCLNHPYFCRSVDAIATAAAVPDIADSSDKVNVDLRNDLRVSEAYASITNLTVESSRSRSLIAGGLQVPMYLSAKGSVVPSVLTYFKTLRGQDFSKPLVFHQVGARNDGDMINIYANFFNEIVGIKGTNGNNLFSCAPIENSSGGVRFFLPTAVAVPDSEDLVTFEVIGKVLAKACIDRRPFFFPVPPVVWRYFTGKSVSSVCVMDDLEYLNLPLTVELRQRAYTSGSSASVRAALVEEILGSRVEQLNSIRRGFLAGLALPPSHFSQLSATQMAIFVMGLSCHFDHGMVLNCLSFKDWDLGNSTVHNFRRVLSRLHPYLLRCFIMWCSGCCVIPSDGFNDQIRVIPLDFNSSGCNSSVVDEDSDDDGAGVTAAPLKSLFRAHAPSLTLWMIRSASETILMDSLVAILTDSTALL